MKRRLSCLLAAGLVAAVASVPQASTARFWLVSTQADLLKGEVERLSIDYSGRLVIGPSARTVFDSNAPFIWTLATGPDGTLYAGGGNDGLVWRIDRDGKSRVFFDAAELEVHALAVGRDGTVYAGTSPDGKVYKIDAQGRSSVFFDPEDKYIWALAVDPQGQMFVGTGDKGLIYKVGPDGKGTVFCKTLATHAVAFAFDRQGQLLAGTESPGRVLRVSAAGKALRPARHAVSRTAWPARRQDGCHLRRSHQRKGWRNGTAGRRRPGRRGAQDDRDAVGLGRDHHGDGHRLGPCRRAGDPGAAAAANASRQGRGLPYRARRRLRSHLGVAGRPALRPAAGG
jgi:hypothetical protein